MSGLDITKTNPYENYRTTLASNLTFGPAFDEWVCETMLDAVLPSDYNSRRLVRLADVGAGSCHWARLLAARCPDLRIVAVEPADTLINGQAQDEIKKLGRDEYRIEPICMTGQAFASEYSVRDNAFDTIYFMQSAHFIGDGEFDDVFVKLGAKLRPRTGKLVIQARNMTPEWHPWPFPFEWKQHVATAFAETGMYRRADLYRDKLALMSSVYRDVFIHERSFEVKTGCDAYWQRLEDRFLPTLISEERLPGPIHRFGIDEMKRRYRKKGETSICWLEKFAIVTAYVH
jgi:trans-aconitate methyltransferase